MRLLLAATERAKALRILIVDTLREIGERIYPTRLGFISENDRKDALQHLYDPAFEDLTGVSTFILTEIKDEAKLKNELVGGLEKIAISQITVAGTLIAIFGVFNHSYTTQWLVGIVVLASAVVLSSIALWPRNDKLPSTGAFNFGPTLRDMSHKDRIAASLSEAWIGFCFELQILEARKRSAVIVAWIFMFVGALVLGGDALRNATFTRQTVSNTVPFVTEDRNGEPRSTAAKRRASTNGCHSKRRQKSKPNSDSGTALQPRVRSL